MKKFKKTKKEILREFNKEKYYQLLVEYKKLKKKINLNLTDIDQLIIKKKFKTKKLIQIKKIILKNTRNYISKKKTIVEFGCGYGSVGLFLMKNKNLLSNKFIFLDIANNGIRLLKQLAADLKIKNKKLQTGFVDIYNGKIDKKIKIPENSVFITVGSMLYKKKHNDKFINFFIKYKFKKILFFEPIYEYNLNNKKICNYFIKNNYHQNFLKLLTENKKIKIILEKKNLFSLNKLLPYSLVIIKRIKSY
jgi:hypothetical protein